MLPISAVAVLRSRERTLLLEVDHLDVRYGRTHAVKSVSLTVGRDELVTVLGANGAGKTSLLRALRAWCRSGGNIRFDGEDITGCPRRSACVDTSRSYPRGGKLCLACRSMKICRWSKGANR